MHRLLCLGQTTLLGPDGQAVTGAAAQPRRLALLAALGRLAPRAASRERLLGWFWPDADEERGRRSLNQALYAIRSELGSEEVLLGQRDLRLNLDLVSSDAADFEAAIASGRLEDAATLYRGPFLDGFHLPSAPEFSQWVDEERTVLAHRFLEVLETLATGAESRADHAAAVGWWRRAAGADPANARLAQRLMLALAASGDRTGAIRHATIHEAMMQQQFELPPDPAVLALAEELRRTPEVTGPRPVPVATPAPVPIPQSPPPAPADATTATVGTARRPVRRIGWMVAAATVGLVAVAVALRARRPASPRDAGPPLVAVLPLDNRTGDSTFSLAGAMVTDWVTQELAMTGLVRVVDSRTMLTAAGNLQDLAARSGAGLIVSGSVFREGDSLRFTTRITDGRTGEIRMPIEPVSAPAAEPTSALLRLRQMVTGALAVLVDSRLNNFTATASRPPTWVAYQEFLLGMRVFGRPYDSSLARFSRAASLDTSYIQARLWAGNTLANLRRYPQADSVFREVVTRRDRLAPYDQANLDYFYGGYVLGDWERSYRGATTMASLAPQAGHALWAVGHTARFTNRARQALEALSRIDLETGWGREWAVRILGEMARDHHLLGEHEAELARARQALPFAPDDGWARTNEAIALAALLRYRELAARVEAAVALPEAPSAWETYSAGDLIMQVARELAAHGAPADTVRRYAEAAVTWYAAPTGAGLADTVHLLGHARSAATAGRHQEARELYQRLVAANPASPEPLGGAAAMAAYLGDTAAAVAGLSRLQALAAPYHFGYPARWAANVAAALGRRDEAVRWLGESLRQGHTWRFRWHADPDLISLRDYEPFRALLQTR